MVIQGESPSEFVLAIATLQMDVHLNAVNKGWWDGEEHNKAEKLCLMHGELSEAMEALRDGNPPDSHLPEFSSEVVELADTVIRILDYAGHYHLPLAEAIYAKHAYNKNRPVKHGGKKF